MAKEAVKVIGFKNAFSRNILPSYEGTLSINEGNNATAEWDYTFGYEFDKSIKITYINALGTPLNFYIEDYSKVIEKTGNYIFSYRLYRNGTSSSNQVVFNIFANELPVEIINTDFTNGDEYSNEWITFTQSFSLTAGVVFSFSIEVNTDDTLEKNWIGGFQLELDNENLQGEPSNFSYPDNYFSISVNTLSNEYFGWGYYVDSLATPTITIDTDYTQITIDALGANITDYLPKEIRGISELWTGEKITPVAIGDDYDGRLDLTVTAKTGSPTKIEFIIDISGSTPGTNKAFTGYLQNIGDYPYDHSIPLDFFSLATFLANGGRIYARVDTGTLTIARRNIKISRKSKYFI